MSNSSLDTLQFWLSIHADPPLDVDGRHYPDTLERRRLAQAIENDLAASLDEAREALTMYARFPDLVRGSYKNVLGKIGPQMEGLGEAMMKRFEKATVEARRLAEQQAEEHAQREAQIQAYISKLVVLGKSTLPETWSLLGWRTSDSSPVVLSREGGQVLLLMGNQGSGKTRSLVALGESLVAPLPYLTSFGHQPTMVAAFHCDPGGARLPEWVAGVRKNPNQAEVEFMARSLGVTARALPRITLVVPEWLLPEYQARLAPLMDAGLRVMPLRLKLADLSQVGLEAALGAKADSAYVQQMIEIAQQQGDNLDIHDWHRQIDKVRTMDARTRERAHSRLRLLDRIASREQSLWDLAGPDQITIFMLGGKWIGQDGLPLLVALCRGLLLPSAVHGSFQRVILIDENNRFERDPDVVEHLMQMIRYVRHQGSMLGLSAQDFSGMPNEFLGLSTGCAIFRTRSPQLYEEVQRRITGFSRWPFAKIAEQLPGQAVLSVTESSDPNWRDQAQQIYFRPLLCDYGGHTLSEV